MSLWSDLDVAWGHVKRYGRDTLRSELEEAGLIALRMSFFFQSLLLPLWLRRLRVRRAGRMRDSDGASVVRLGLAPPPPAINTMMSLLCGVEGRISSVLPLGCFPGGSLFFAARRAPGNVTPFHRPVT